jgi:DNA-binding MarR family transcriptional regulator
MISQDMTQDELLEIIRQEPGIELCELRRRASISSSAVSAQIRGLERRGLIMRKTVRTLKTWSLFPIEAENQGM